MNIIEQLMIEHQALRLHFYYLREANNSDRIYEIEQFVRNCHARIEDEIVFPKLGEVDYIRQVLSRLAADHKMIDAIGDQIKLRTSQGDLDLLKKRVLLYTTTVESHNSSEESLLFPHWKADESTERSCGARSRTIIEEFGLNRYFAITGFSQKLLDLVML